MTIYPGMAATAGAGGGGGGLVEHSSLSLSHDVSADPIQDTISIPAGSNRVLLDLFGLTNPEPYDDRLNPSGANTLLTEITGSPQNVSVGADEYALGFRLMEADFPSPGSNTLSLNVAAGRTCARRVIILSGASQTIHSAGNKHNASGALTVSVTRSSGTFPAGSRIYSCLMSQSTGTYGVTGDVSEVDDILQVNDRWVFAAGTVASPVATVNAIFTRDVSATVRKQALIMVVEPA